MKRINKQKMCIECFEDTNLKFENVIIISLEDCYNLDLKRYSEVNK